MVAAIASFTVSPFREKPSMLLLPAIDVNRVYSLDELVRGNDILFSATGVTGGELVNGIQQTANGVRTQTLLIGGADQTCNIIDSLH